MNVFRQGSHVIGHRGSPRKALENTLASFDLAEADGADGVELDVRLTLDGEAVVLHDPELVRGDRRLPVGSLTVLDVKSAPARKGELEGEVPT
ncbi:glycerophosphodiester phosphodiesterase, partial [Acidobacteria bacterium ACD]|nr:glycerophosphodiester phosphodiesterase [Acidobacteria bacterium ACD]